MYITKNIDESVTKTCVFSCDQAALRILLSVCPSVLTPFSQCSLHCIIIDKRDVRAKSKCQRLKVKVLEVKTQFCRFHTVTRVWIHIGQWNDVQSLMLLRRDALLFFNVSRQFLRSHGWETSILTQLGRFRIVTPVWIQQCLQDDAHSLK